MLTIRLLNIYLIVQTPPNYFCTFLALNWFKTYCSIKIEQLLKVQH